MHRRNMLKSVASGAAGVGLVAAGGSHGAEAQPQVQGAGGGAPFVTHQDRLNADLRAFIANNL